MASKLITATLFGGRDEEEYNTGECDYMTLPKDQEYIVVNINIDHPITDGEQFIERLDVVGEVLTYDEICNLCFLFEILHRQDQEDCTIAFDMYEAVAVSENRAGFEALIDLAHNIEDYLIYDFQGYGKEDDNYVIGMSILNLGYAKDEILQRWLDDPNKVSKEEVEEVGKTYRDDFTIYKGYIWREN